VDTLENKQEKPKGPWLDSTIKEKERVPTDTRNERGKRKKGLFPSAFGKGKGRMVLAREGVKKKGKKKSGLNEKRKKPPLTPLKGGKI